MKENANSKKVLSIMSQCQKEFDRNLKNKKLLFLLQSKDRKFHIEEVFFPKSSFLHLTGYNVYRRNNEKLNSYEFYNMLNDRKLNNESYIFKRKNNTSDLKLMVLPKVMNIDKNAKMIGLYDKSRIYLKTEKIVGSIFNCIGIIKANKYTYIPNTILNEDIRKITTDRYKIVAIFKKENMENLYKEITFLHKDLDIKKIEFIKILSNKVDFNNIQYFTHTTNIL